MRVSEVANYFIYLRNKGKRNGEKRYLSSMKLQLLIYFSYALYAVASNGEKRLFNDAVIKAGRYGPFIDTIYYTYIVYGQSDIPESEGGAFDDLDDETKKILNEVWETLSDTSAYNLVEIAQAEHSPWHTHYEEWKSQEIPYEDIYLYFGG